MSLTRSSRLSSLALHNAYWSVHGHINWLRLTYAIGLAMAHGGQWTAQIKPVLQQKEAKAVENRAQQEFKLGQGQILTRHKLPASFRRPNRPSSRTRSLTFHSHNSLNASRLLAFIFGFLKYYSSTWTRKGASRRLDADLLSRVRLGPRLTTGLESIRPAPEQAYMKTGRC